jgi:hypothetical protein
MLLIVPLKNILNGIIFQQAQDYQVYAQKLFIDYLLSSETTKTEESPGFNTREDLEKERESLVNFGNDFNELEYNHKTLIAESQKSLLSLAKNLQNILSSAVNEMKKTLKEQGVSKDEKIVFQAVRESISDYEKLDDEILSNSSVFWSKLNKALDIQLSDKQQAQFANIFLEFNGLRDEIKSNLDPYLERSSDIEINLKSFRSQFYNIILRSTELINMLPDYIIDKERDQENRGYLYFDSSIGE